MNNHTRTQNKEEYRKFCQLHPEMPLFQQDWWLDIVCPKQWDVVLYKNKGGDIVGVLPYYLSSYWGMQVIKMPVLTPYMGVWISYPDNIIKIESRYRLEKKVINHLIDQLPKVAYYAQKHPISLRNHLPFLWNEFQQTTFYTFVIPNNLNIDSYFSHLNSSVRNKIRKAKKFLNIEIGHDLTAFYQLNQQSFERQSLRIPYSFELIQELDKILSQKKQRIIYIAKDQNNQPHAAIYLAWDDTTIYNLMIGVNTQLRSSGAVQLLLWKGIELAVDKNLNFDFEGGMMENIENIFQAFGGELTPYHKIWKGGNLFFRLINAIRNI